MILQTPKKSARRPVWGLLVLALTLTWGGFVLTGAALAGDPAGEISEQAIEFQVQKILTRIGQYPSADVDHDGEISFTERNAFLVTVFLTSPATAIEAFPYGESMSGQIDLPEAYDLVRGLSYREKAEVTIKQRLLKASQAGAGNDELRAIKGEYAKKRRALLHVILTAQDSLLDQLGVEPSPEQVAEVLQKLTVFRAENELKELTMKADQIRKEITRLQAAGEQEKVKELTELLQQIEQKLAQSQSWQE